MSRLGGKRTYQCMNGSRRNIHENITEVREHGSSNIQGRVPGEGEEGGGQGGPKEPAKIRGNRAVQKAVDFVIKSMCFVNWLFQIDQVKWPSRGGPGESQGGSL